MFQLYIQYLPCSFQCIIGDVTDGESLSASHWHDKLNARCVSCRNVAINVACRAVSQQPAAADGHQPFVSHIPTSRSAARIKTSMRRNLTTTIVFNELVEKGKQAHQSRCLCLVLSAITCCTVTLIQSHSNDTASATDSAEAGHD